MAHYLIAGMTGSGKTTLCRSVFSEFRQRRIPTAVLDPMLDLRWEADFKTDSIDAFMRFVMVRKRGMLAMDEGGSFGKFNDQIEWLMTKGRHLEHSIYLITQYPAQVSPIVRGQCEKLYLFAASEPAVKMFSTEFRKPALLAAPPLNRGEFYQVSRFEEISKFSLDFRTGKVNSAGK